MSKLLNNLKQWTRQRFRYFRQDGIPFQRGTSLPWRIRCRRHFELWGRMFPRLFIEVTTFPACKRPLADYWPPQVQARLEADLLRIARGGDRQLLRWHWSKWEKQGYLSPATDADLQRLIARAMQEKENGAGERQPPAHNQGESNAK